MSESPPIIVKLADDPTASKRILGSVFFDSPKKLAEGIEWLLACPDIGTEFKHSVTLRLEAAGQRGWLSLVYLWRPTLPGQRPTLPSQAFALRVTGEPL